MDLVYPGEKLRFRITATLAGLFWLLLIFGTRGLALGYVLLFFIGYLFAQSGWISYLRGNAVKLSADQFPDLNARVLGAARRLNVDAPTTYVLHHDGIFNALATRFLGRDYIVLYSTVLDALDPLPGAVDFYIGHEMGHIERKHLAWNPFLAPMAWLPLLGCALRRAEEYTCDRYGLAACENKSYAKIALAALASGSTRWKKFNPAFFQAQAAETRGFWMSYHELTNDYPWLSKRMVAIDALSLGQEPQQTRRNALAYLLAFFTPRVPGAAGGGGGLVSMMIIVASIGILAAIAILAYQSYVKRQAAAQGDAGQPEQSEQSGPADSAPPVPAESAPTPTQKKGPPPVSEAAMPAYLTLLLQQTYRASEGLRTGAEQYYQQNGSWAMTAAQIGEQDGAAVIDPARNVSAVYSFGEGSQINVQFNGGPLEGQSLLMAPNPDANGNVKWRCISPGINNKLLPPQCS